MTDKTFFPILYLINDRNNGDHLLNRLKVAETPEQLPTKTQIIVIETNFKPMVNWREYVKLGMELEFKYGARND